MSDVSKLFDYVSYADDTTLSFTLSSVRSHSAHDSEINIELGKISKWLKVKICQGALN